MALADPCTTYAIDSGGPYNVIANSFCNRIEVRENFNSVTPPTADLKQYRPAGSLTPVNIPLGTSAIFTPYTGQNDGFKPGQVVGQIQTVSGSITVAQIESTQV